MAEFTANELQSVSPNQAILFTEVPVRGNASIIHREGSGIVTLRAMTCQPFARFKVTFGANVSIPTGGTVEAITVAIAQSGEQLNTTEMTVTPAAVSEFFNVSRSTYINVPGGCCTQISVENVSTQAIDIQNANLLVERVA